MASYRVGVLESPNDDDERFETQEEAEIAAINLSFNDSVIAVWDEDDDQIVALVYQQTVYSP